MSRRIALGALAFVLWFALYAGGKALIAIGIGHNRPFIFLFTIAVLVAYYAVARWIERRDPQEIAFARSPLALWGAALGLALFSATIAVLALAGMYHFDGLLSAAPLVGGAIASFAAAIGEELLFRGFIFRWLEIGTGTWIAIAISAALFGLAHALNRGATAGEVISVAVEAGILLSAAYVYTRSLWLPIGIHFGWDFSSGAIFGSPVAGAVSTKGLISGALVGPAAFTGGNSGIDASVVAVLLCLLVAGAMLAAARRAGRITSPFWHKI